jgi:hypothetical protein
MHIIDHINRILIIIKLNFYEINQIKIALRIILIKKLIITVHIQFPPTRVPCPENALCY